MGRYQFLIYLIPVVLAVMQTVYRAYQKKRALIDAENAERERQQTILRTGRDPLAEQAAAAQREAQRREAEIMAERQEALRELRRQQGETATPGSPPPVPQPAMGGGNRGGGGPGGPITRELWPGGPVIVIGGAEPAPQRQDTRQRRPEQVQQREPEQIQSRSQQQSRKKQRQRPQQVPRDDEAPSTLQSRQSERHDEAYYQRERSLARMKASTIADDRAVAAEPVFVRPTNPSQWRAALIAAEILGTPVSMRDPETAPGGPSH